MKDLAKKVAIGVATGALVMQSLVIPSFATVNVVVSGNGADSENTVDVSKTNTTAVQQTNTANVSNNIDAKANSGDNEVKDSTGGDVKIDTGDADSAVVVKNTLNSNEASVACGGCPTDLGILVSGNGAHSTSDVNTSLTNTTQVDQNNAANVENHVDAKSNTGKNDVKDSTGGNVSIDTGDASAWAAVTNKANANVANVSNGAGAESGALDILVTGNGAHSENDVNTALSNTTWLKQNNWADISNDVEVDANTGKNRADDNTGGSSSISTGNADSAAKVDNMANFNVAHVEDCCQFDGLVKVAGNGADSENDVNFDVASVLVNTQDNSFSCGENKSWLEWWRNDCNNVEAKSNTGKNKLNDSTSRVWGDPTIDTGDASNQVEVKNTGNSNVFTTGDAIPELPSFGINNGTNGSWDFFVWMAHSIWG
jgi:hypothetical protein